MVFCRECRKQVEECEHFVPPLRARHVVVFDPRVKTLAYDERQRILEIGFKNGQTWQLRGVSADTYATIMDQNISSFLKFVAHRYQTNPVRTSVLPVTEACPDCIQPMTIRHKTATQPPARILWHCHNCNKATWKTYGDVSSRETKQRWH